VLDRRGDVALMLHAVARDAASPQLAPLGHELAQRDGVLVVDVVDAVLAEDAELALALLLPGLIVLFLAALRAAFSFSRHPVGSPLDRFRHRRPEPRPSRPSHRMSWRRWSGTAARPVPWPTGGWDRPRRPRSRWRCASRRPGSPTSGSSGARPRPRAIRGSAT